MPLDWEVILAVHDLNLATVGVPEVQNLARPKHLIRALVALSTLGWALGPWAIPVLARNPQAEMLAEAHRLRLQLKTEEALSLANQILVRYPKFAAAYDFRSDLNRELG
jgi:hypothetical protein